MRFFAVFVFLIGLVSASAYVRNERRAGFGYFVSDPSNVRFAVDQGTNPGMTNDDGTVIISEESSPKAAVWAAMRRWNSLPGSTLRLLPPTSTASRDAQLDGINLITFADTPSHRSIVGGAIAVTRLFSGQDGELTDTDIVFSPLENYSTTAEPDAFDIEGTLAHEIGHALGLDHSGSATATMFATTVKGSTRLRSLSLDDRAFAADVYPSPEANAIFGALTGRVTLASGGPARSVTVVAQDAGSNVTVSALTDQDGFYQMPALLPGSYVVYVEPLDGPAHAFQLGPTRGIADQAFTTTFVGGSGTPSPVFVGNGSQTTLDVTLDGTLSLLNVQGLGVAIDGQDPISFIGAPIPRGGRASIETFGTAFDAPGMGEQAVSFLGAGVTVVPGTYGSVGRIRVGDGPSLNVVGFQVDVAPDAPLGTVSVRFQTPDGLSMMTGGIEIVEAIGPPTFATSGVANAAGFSSGPIAPGQIISIFGLGLGARANWSPSFFDPLTNLLTPSLDDVTVLFNGKPGAVFFASDGQLNVQAVSELIPGSEAVIEVVYEERRSAAVSVPVTAQAPGLFTFEDGIRLVALNQDGSVNGPQNPAAPGTVVTFFANGQGALDGPLGTGQAADSGPRLRRVRGAVELVVGGVASDVLFAGMTPGLVGLMQANARLGSGTPLGQVEVILRIRGTASRSGTLIWVG